MSGGGSSYSKTFALLISSCTVCSADCVMHGSLSCVFAVFLMKDCTNIQLSNYYFFWGVQLLFLIRTLMAILNVPLCLIYQKAFKEKSL